MSIIKRGSSLNWYVQFQIAGRTIIRSARTTNRKVAEQFEARLRTQVHAERFLGQKQPLTLQEALDRFVQSRAGTPNHRNLLSHRKIILEKIRGSKRLDDITSDDIEEFRRWRVAKGATGQTVKHSLDLIRGTWKLAKRQGHRVSDLSFPSIKLPKGRMRYLTVEEERLLLAELDPARISEGMTDPANRRPDMVRMVKDAYELVVLLLDTGARYSEIANIEWRQIDLDGRIIRLWRSKVQNESVLFMTIRVHAILSRRQGCMEGSAYVFTNKSGGPRGYARMSIRKAMNRAGLSDCTIHTLRHTHATRLIQNGLSLYEVQAVLGHSDIKTTSRYAHLEQSKVTAKARDVIDAMNARAQV